MLALAACGSQSPAELLDVVGSTDGASVAWGPPSADTARPGPHRPRLGAAALLEAAQRGSEQAQGFVLAAGGARAEATSLRDRLHVELAEGALRLAPAAEPAGWTLALRWTGLGRIGAVAPAPRVEAGPVVEAGRASYRHAGGAEQWYADTPRGIEQGFTLAERPPGDGGDLVIEIGVGDGFTPVLTAGGREISLRAADGRAAVRYSDLLAREAGGRTLPARMQVGGQAIRLMVDDRGARYPVTVDPLVWVEEQKLIAGDGAKFDVFGRSVALGGDRAIVGATGDDDGGPASGSAYVFVRQAGQWVQEAKLTASDAGVSDCFGVSVATDADTAVVGADEACGFPYGSGLAYVFVRQGAIWTQQAKLAASDPAPGDFFGESVAIDGDTVVVGVPGDEDAGPKSGSAYVFVRQGGAWTQQAKLTASDAASDDAFGVSVAVNGETVIVGAMGNGDHRGAAYVFVRQGGAWVEQTKLTALDGEPFDFLGSSVALDGDTAVAGAPSDEDAGPWSGSAYVFARQGGAWTQQAKLTADDAAVGHELGFSVAISGDSVLAGALANKPSWQYGAAYVFVRSGSNWLQQAELAVDGLNPEPAPMFGFSVAISGATALVGALQDLDMAGSAYVFERPPASVCTIPPDCASGFCVDGYCCDHPCGGGASDDCLACSIAAGGTADGFCAALSDGSPCAEGACHDGLCEPPGAGGSAGSAGTSAGAAAGGAGGGGAGTSAGAGGLGPSPATGGTTGAGQDISARGDCGCRLAGSPPPLSPPPLPPLLALALLLRRARRNPNTPRPLRPANAAYGMLYFGR
ncbi:MAG: FG-GAP repeat protein [Deltaproteobacteria bacterium]|nr:FG-GAP repeat protein [Deltaproteobacteria bacterium]